MALEKNHKIALGLAVLATVGAGIAAWFYFDSKAHAEQEQANSQNQANPTSMVSNISENQIISDVKEPKIEQEILQVPNVEGTLQDTKANRLVAYLKQRAAIEKTQPNLSMKFIMEINEGLIELCAGEYTKVTKTGREKRREVRTIENLQAYMQIVLTGTHYIEKALMENMGLLLQQCGVSMESFEASNKHWSQINPQFALLTMLLLDKLKLSVQHTKSCTLETALEIFDYQLANYQGVVFPVGQLEPQLVPMIKQSWLSDMVYEKFGMEEEDYIKAPGLESSMQFREKAQQLAQMIQIDAQAGGMMMPDMMGDMMRI